MSCGKSMMKKYTPTHKHISRGLKCVYNLHDKFIDGFDAFNRPEFCWKEKKEDSSNDNGTKFIAKFFFFCQLKNVWRKTIVKVKEPAQQHLLVFIYMFTNQHSVCFLLNETETLWEIFMTWWCFIPGFKCCTCDERIQYYSASCSSQIVPACIAHSSYVFVSKKSKQKSVCVSLLF